MLKNLFFVTLIFLGTGVSYQLLAIEADTAVSSDSSKRGALLDVKHPFIEVTGGNTTFSYDNDSRFQPDLTIGVVAGFYSSKQLFSSDVQSTSLGGVFLTNVRSSDTTASDVSVDAWRFGIQNSVVYSLPLATNSSLAIDFGAIRAPLSWFAQSFPAVGTDSTTAAQMKGRFDGVRFGESAKASIGLRVADPISINAGFEWGQAYERHLVWYWALSGIIESVADGVGSYFVSAVGKSSPLASPIVHFIVRNGIAMGFKALRMNQMNWPFTTAAPLNYFTYSVGVSVRL